MKSEAIKSLKDIKCPICGNPINGYRSIGDYNYNGKVILLAECWSGDTSVDKPCHAFLIKLTNIPEVEIQIEIQQPE